MTALTPAFHCPFIRDTRNMMMPAENMRNTVRSMASRLLFLKKS